MRKSSLTPLNAGSLNIRIIKSEFTKICKLFIYCYQEIITKEIFRVGVDRLDEDFFRNKIVSYARRYKDKFSLGHLHFLFESGVSNENFHTIGRIDIQVLGSQIMKRANEDFYFAFECKRLSKKAKNNDYINEGLARFVVEEKYSKNIPFAGMIGFIEDGEPQIIIEDLANKILYHTDNNIKSKLTVSILTSEFDCWYLSSHCRKFSLKNIELHHLFFDFTKIISA